MTVVLSVEIGNERRVYTLDDLPLSVGGAGCHLALDGLQDERAVAYLGHDRGQLFVQPSDDRSNAVRMTCNGIPLTTSRWLDDGDEIGVNAHRLRCETTGDSVRLALVRSKAKPSPQVEANVLQPPRTVSSDHVIEPVEFRPRWQSGVGRSRLRVRPTSVLVVAIMALLAAGTWFVFTARAIRIETTPPADSLEIRGGWLTPKIGDGYLLQPGNYTVAAELEGYRSLSEDLEVTRDTPATVGFVFEPLGTLLTITSNPVEHAEITIDGVVVGTTPAHDIELGAGEHEIEITAPLYLPYQATVSVQPGDSPRELTAELAPNWAPLTVTTAPENATVLLDGETIGSTPFQGRIGAGDRLLEIRRHGFKSLSRRLHVAAGEVVGLGHIQLVPVDGQLVVTSNPSGATITIDGIFRGTSPIELDLAPGNTYRVKVSKAGHTTFNTEVEISSGRRSELRAELEMLTGEITVTSVPPRAKLLIDGVPSGTTDRTLELEARSHDIEVRLEGYAPFRTSLTPEPGIPQAVHAVLREEGPAGLPPKITTPQAVELVLVGPGRFTMGAARREPGRRTNEVLHEVELTHPFYLATREVSNREFREFRPEHLSGSVGPYNLEIDHHPVVNVTWNDAARYCNWLSERAGLPPVYVERGGSMVARNPIPQGFRLPTEAEWAWAARYPDSGNARKYAWGDSLPVPTDGGNFGDASAASVLGGAIPGYRDSYAATAPAGSLRANPLGLYNLGGNVAEWMHDVYAVTPSSPNEVTSDPTGPPEGAYHVIRGASWMDTNLTELRLSYRDYGDTARPDLGFRVARSAQ